MLRNSLHTLMLYADCIMHTRILSHIRIRIQGFELRGVEYSVSGAPTAHRTVVKLQHQTTPATLRKARCALQIQYI
jgi:hypothetical protein